MKIAISQEIVLLIPTAILLPNEIVIIKLIRKIWGVGTQTSQ